jgi:hypothetical protein
MAVLLLLGSVCGNVAALPAIAGPVLCNTSDIPQPPPDWSLSLQGAAAELIDRETFMDLASLNPASYTDNQGRFWEGLPLSVLVGLVDDDDPATFNPALAAENYTIIVKGMHWDEVRNSEFSSTELLSGESYVVANYLDGEEIPNEPIDGRLYWPLKLHGSGVSGTSRAVEQLNGIELILPEEPTDLPSAGSDRDASVSYRGAALTPGPSGRINGTVVLAKAAPETGVLPGGGSAGCTIPVLLPDSGTVAYGYLYVYCSDSRDVRTGLGKESSLAFLFEGEEVKPERRYSDRMGRETAPLAETFRINVTGSVGKSGDYTLIVENTGDKTTECTLSGAVLVLACRSDSMPPLGFMIAEGCDVLQAPRGVDSLEDYATTAAFDGSLAIDTIDHADLVVISTGVAEATNGVHRIVLNTEEWGNPITETPDGVAIVHLDAGKALLPAQNMAAVWSVGSDLDGAYLENRNAILLLQEVSAAPGDGSAAAPPAETDDGQEEPIRSPETTPGDGFAPSPAPAEGAAPPAGSLLDALIRILAGLPIIGPFFVGEGAPGQGTEGGAATPAPCESPVPVHNLPEEPRKSAFNLSIRTNPPGALIFLDGTYLGVVSPATLGGLDGDTHTLRVEIDGYDPEERMVELREDGDMTIELFHTGNRFDTRGKLSGVIPGSEVSRSGGLFITSCPSGAEIYVDTRKIGATTPDVVYGLREGVHEVKVTRANTDFGISTREVWVYPDALTPVSFDMSPAYPKDISFSTEPFDGDPITFEGRFPSLQLPATGEIDSDASFVTVLHDGKYLSFSLIRLTAYDGICQITPTDHQIGEILVDSHPHGAAIILDGFVTGRHTPYRITNVSDGDHRVLVTMPGYLPDEEIVRLPRDTDGRPSTTILFDTLQPYPSGGLAVTSTPSGARIYLNGIDSGETTPHTFFSLPIGSRDIRIAGLAGSATVEDVLVTPGGVTPVNVTL